MGVFIGGQQIDIEDMYNALDGFNGKEGSKEGEGKGDGEGEGEAVEREAAQVKTTEEEAAEGEAAEGREAQREAAEGEAAERGAATGEAEEGEERKRAKDDEPVITPQGGDKEMAPIEEEGNIHLSPSEEKGTAGSQNEIVRKREMWNYPREDEKKMDFHRSLLKMYQEEDDEEKMKKRKPCSKGDGADNKVSGEDDEDNIQLG